MSRASVQDYIQESTIQLPQRHAKTVSIGQVSVCFAPWFTVTNIGALAHPPSEIRGIAANQRGFPLAQVLATWENGITESCLALRNVANDCE